MPEEKPEKLKDGRPSTTDEQFQKWLDDMAPFLKLGETLNAAINDADLLKHRNTLYEKYRLKDWFSYKIDAFRGQPGKLSNNVLVKIVMAVDEKMKQNLAPTDEEMRNVRFYAEKSRSAQPYFVNRTETADAKPIDDLLEELDKEGENIDDVAAEAKKQMVEAKPPVQNQEQTGAGSDVQAEPDATQAPN